MKRMFILLTMLSLFAFSCTIEEDTRERIPISEVIEMTGFSEPELLNGADNCYECDVHGTCVCNGTRECDC